MVAGLLLAVALVLMGAFTGVRQVRTVRRLRDEPFLPADERLFLRGQVRRRVCAAAVLLTIGGMIGGYYLSGMDDRMNAIGDRGKGQQAEGAPPDPQEEDDRRFVKQVAWYWTAILGLVFAVASLAVLDFWANRVYWMARYRELRADHEAKLHRDLVVHRHQKLNDRMKGRRKDDHPDDTPPPIP